MTDGVLWKDIVHCEGSKLIVAADPYFFSPIPESILKC